MPDEAGGVAEFALPCWAEPVSVNFSAAAVVEDVSDGIGWTDGYDELPVLGHEGSSEGIAGASATVVEEEQGRQGCEST